MDEQSLLNISPVDGRYHNATRELSGYFSEFALIRYRVLVELKYLQALSDQLRHTKYAFSIPDDEIETILLQFDLSDAGQVKAKEKVTNHDVKAVEYFIKEKLTDKYEKSLEWVHFGLTSQDINNTAFPLMLRDAYRIVMLPVIQSLITGLDSFAREYSDTAMLARTHGQPASPTTLGKEIKVFSIRLQNQLNLLESIPWQGKFGGATGNFNAHYIAFPEMDWHAFGHRFLESIGLERQTVTTQIEHYDMLAAHFQGLSRVCSILIDQCRDIWTYISQEYFKQRAIAGEIGSSAMPHKVNPIDFENAEGNLGVAIALFEHLALKLPVSRLQRDLTDSTVLRNIGVPYCHLLIAIKSILKGWNKLQVNPEHIKNDLDKNAIVLAEAIQTILRRESYPGAYELLKELTRGKSEINMTVIRSFINALNIDPALKAELLKLDVTDYIGKNNY